MSLFPRRYYKLSALSLTQRLSFAYIHTVIHIIWSVIVGFIVGLIAKAVLPGAGHLGFIYTSLLGIGGSVLSAASSEG